MFAVIEHNQRLLFVQIFFQYFERRFTLLLNNANVVKREEFEVVRAMAEKARLENEALAKRLAELELRLGTAAN